VVIVFTRAPVAGRVKTRLAVRLGAERAARLHERLTSAALASAAAARCGAVELHSTARHAWLAALCRARGIPLRLQGGGDLGSRMARATRAALRRAPRVLLIGSDCPELGPRELARAARWLRGAADVVLAPAHDGGYALIGLKRPADFLFRDVAWGTEHVCAETVRRLKAAHWRLRMLDAVHDVDRPEDLERIAWLRAARRLRRMQARHANGFGEEAQDSVIHSRPPLEEVSKCR
jgi:hypothetical protein